MKKKPTHSADLYISIMTVLSRALLQNFFFENDWLKGHFTVSISKRKNK